MESIWDKKKGIIARSLGVVLILVLVATNVWLLEKATNSQVHGIAFSPADVSSFFRNTEQSATWEGSHNILILGRAGEGNNAPNLTDTIFIAHTNADNKIIKLVSLPRDLLVELPEKERFIKLNAFWSYTSENEQANLNPVRTKISEITGLEIHRVVVFDLTTFEQIIDAIDGVVVHVPNDIYDPRFPTDTGGYEAFSLQSGWRHLDARTAEQFVRTRHTPSGDFDRIANQQEIVRSIKGKLASLNPVWDFGTLWSVYEALQNNVITDLSATDARALWNFANTLSLEEVNNFVLNVESGLVEPRTVQFGNTAAYTLVPTRDDPFDYASIQSAITNFIEN